jgi:hypothetical protein
VALPRPGTRGEAKFATGMRAEVEVATGGATLAWVVSNGGRVTALLLEGGGWGIYPKSPKETDGQRHRWRIETTGAYHIIYRDDRRRLEYRCPGTREFLRNYGTRFTAEEQEVIAKGGAFMKVLKAGEGATLYRMGVNRKL